MHCPAFNAGYAVGVGDHHLGFEHAHRGDPLDHLTQEQVGVLEVRHDTLAQRPGDFHLLGNAAIHVQGGLTDLDDLLLL